MRLRTFMVTVGLVLGMTVGIAGTAQAHTITCGSYGATPSFTCVGGTGYSGQRPWGYPVDANGHNCTNYVSYRLWQNGANNPGNLGNAYEWDNRAASYGILVDGTPAVGSVAVWEINHAPAMGSGHVAYVEAVTSSYIDISEDNYGGTTMRKRFFVGQADWPDHFVHIKDVASPPSSPPTPLPDTDSDGVADASDIAPAIAGPVNNRGIPNFASKVTGDFNGDSKTDVAAFYDFGGCNTQLFMFAGTGSGTFAAPVSTWSGSWCWGAAKPTVEDYNGDGKADIAAFYDFSGGTTKLFMFYGTASGLTAPTSVWDSGAGNWFWSSTLQVTGDFNGDGKADIAAFYDFNGCSTQLFVFNGNGSGTFSTPASVWSGSWCWGAAKPTVSDYNSDGRDDIAALYNFGGGNTQLFMFAGTTTGFNSPVSVWSSGTGNWFWEATTQVTGDFNGDGKADIAAFYNFNGCNTQLFVFNGTGSGTFAAPTSTWSGSWCWAAGKPTVGDFNGDSRTDVAAFYDFNGCSTQLFVFNGTTSGITAPASAWNSGGGNWCWGATLTP